MLVALFLVIRVNSVIVQENESQNVTTVKSTIAVLLSEDKKNSSSLKAENLKLENRQIDSDESTEFVPTTPSSIQKIPPTLLNTRIEMTGMTLRDLA